METRQKGGDDLKFCQGVKNYTLSLVKSPPTVFPLLARMGVGGAKL